MLSVVMVRTVVIPSREKSKETKYFMVIYTQTNKQTNTQKDLEIWWDGSNKVYNSKQTIFDMIPILMVQWK